MKYYVTSPYLQSYLRGPCAERTIKWTKRRKKKGKDVSGGMKGSDQGSRDGVPFHCKPFLPEDLTEWCWWEFLDDEDDDILIMLLKVVRRNNACGYLNRGFLCSCWNIAVRVCVDIFVYVFLHDMWLGGVGYGFCTLTVAIMSQCVQNVPLGSLRSRAWRLLRDNHMFCLLNQLYFDLMTHHFHVINALYFLHLALWQQFCTLLYTVNIDIYLSI